MAKTVFMQRNSEQWPAPHTANVHPDEVANYRLGGFVPVEPPTPETAEEKAARLEAEVAEAERLANVEAETAKLAEKKSAAGWGAPPPA
jgi:hypothetical protein